MMEAMGEQIRTVQLGQFTHEHANSIAGGLEEAGITWWYKQPGWFSGIWEKGTRLFVDEARLGEARDIARRVLSGEYSPPTGPGQAE